MGIISIEELAHTKGRIIGVDFGDRRTGLAPVFRREHYNLSAQQELS